MMCSRPMIRRTVERGAVVLSAFLFVAWIASLWYSTAGTLHPTSNSSIDIHVGGGAIDVMYWPNYGVVVWDNTNLRSLRWRPDCSTMAGGDILVTIPLWCPFVVALASAGGLRWY